MADTTTWATAFALAYVVFLFGIGGVVGTVPFWQMPMGGGAIDMRQTLSGYYWFIHDDWRWPLLVLKNPDWPTGTNALFFDIGPWIAILGKLTYKISGWHGNPYAIWSSACFALNGVALALLVRTLGARSILAAVLAGAFGTMAPVAAFRFLCGHLNLLAHWVPILALALYFQATRAGGFKWQYVAAALGLCVFAVGIHLYFYAMTAAIVAALALQWLMDRQCSLIMALIIVCGVVAAGVVPLWAFGFFGSAGLADLSGRIGYNSMNLMTPFWPQTSGLFRWTGIYLLTRGTIGAQAGQYDGFNYVGGGALFLVMVALWLKRDSVLPSLRRHLALTIVALVLTLWAISNVVYFGPYHVLSYPVPSVLAHTVLGWFRASGRMFWPVNYLLVGFGIATLATHFRPLTTLGIAGLALLLQVVDVTPWRATIAELLSQPEVSAFGSPSEANRVAEAIGSTHEVSVAPAIFCKPMGYNYLAPPNIVAAEVQLMAAQLNARMLKVYQSRIEGDCLRRPSAGESSTMIYPKQDGAPIFNNEASSSGGACFETKAARVCVVKK